MAIVTPEWGHSGPNAQWRRLLDRLTVRRVILPNIPLYEKFGDKSKLLPKPLWSSMLSMIDGGLNSVSEMELDPTIVALIRKKIVILAETNWIFCAHPKIQQMR